MSLRRLLGVNLFLQVFDGSASYLILSRGESELNPFVSAAIEAWGLVWALLYWKLLVCVLLTVLYLLGRFQVIVPLRGLTFVAIVYASLAVYLTWHLLVSVST
jgi:Domain of unknown function (DUF5658)